MDAAKIMALAHQGFDQGLRLAAALGHQYSIARPNEGAQIKMIGLDFARSHGGWLRPAATTAWACFNSGPSIMRPSCEMVPLPEARASS